MKSPVYFYFIYDQTFTSRTSPGRSSAFHYGDFDSDGEDGLASALAQSQAAARLGDEELEFQTSLETSQLGASTAKHEHIVLAPSSPQPEDESRTQDLIGI